MAHQCVEKARFIGKVFIDARAVALDIPDEHQRERTLYRYPGSSLFVLATVGYDFRDDGWQIDLSLGDGYPEKAEDPVEYQISAISLAELGILQDATQLPLNISQTQLESLVEPAVNYCLRFITGDAREALLARLNRNASRASDPLWIESKNSHNKDMLESRNEELKKLYAKYL